MTNHFSSHNFETSKFHATTEEDFFEELEPTPTQPRDMLAEAIGKILEHCCRSTKTNTANPEYITRQIESSYRRFFALVLVLKPELLPADLPHHRWAEILGVTKQALSLRCIEWSDILGGLRSGSMKSATARENYSKVIRHGHKGKPHRAADGISQRTDQDGLQRTERILADAFEYFRNGKPWTKLHRRELRLAGLITEADELTEAGQARLQGHVEGAIPPAARSLLGA